MSYCGDVKMAMKGTIVSDESVIEFMNPWTPMRLTWSWRVANCRGGRENVPFHTRLLDGHIDDLLVAIGIETISALGVRALVLHFDDDRGRRKRRFW
jgi:hypothetical protein